MFWISRKYFLDDANKKNIQIIFNFYIRLNLEY